MKKLTLLLFVALCSILLADGTPAQGQGTESSPYLIANLDNLLWLSTTPEVWGTWHSEGRRFYFEQTADIDASDTQNWNDGQGFSPIGDFYCNYNGNNKLISNLYINRPEQSHSGMFSRAIKSTITNLRIENCNITGGGCTGGLVGYTTSSTITNCYATGNINSNFCTGGLIGSSLSSSITNCYVNGSVTGSEYTGGLIGNADSSNMVNCYATSNVNSYYATGGLVGKSLSSSIINCYATGNINGGGNAGGLVGDTESSFITNCYATGNINGGENAGGLVGEARYSNMVNCYATSNVTSNRYTGGLAGKILYANIANCYATGNITGGYYIGGLIGEANTSDIANCYATGNITGGYYIGGLAGHTISSTITNCYATCFVDGEENTGGLIGYGYPDDSIITNSYWDIETSGQTTSADGGESKTTAEMKQQSTYENWFFGYTWSISPEINNGYPYLLWQVNEEICFLQGNGNIENPYQISNLIDLLYLSVSPKIWKKYFIQTTDIDATETQNWNDGQGFSPIGNFYGTYDGNNKTISNLYINRPGQNNIGLFAKIEDSEIKNLGIENCIIVGGWHTAGLVASNYHGSAIITNCHVTGSITGNRYTGGLIGYVKNENNSTITNCYTTGNITGNDCTGGLIGSTNNSTITNCYTTGNVTGNYSTGGFIGKLLSSYISNCYATGNITGNDYTGGLVGCTGSSFITNCYATGNVTGETRVGGFIGSTYKAKITNCYATGNVNGNDYTGGLIGDACSSNMVNCYTTCFVDGEENTGGLIGYEFQSYPRSIITNSYWDIETSGQTTSAGGGEGKTTAEMKQQSTYQNWLFGEVWAINPNINNGYPYFVDEPIVDADDETNQVTPSTNAFSYVIGPNPFNPSTNISFSLDKTEKVNIKVYNVKGQLVKTLLNKKLASGQHTINFNAAGKASGVYFINVKVNGKNNIKKALLLK